MPYIHDLPMTQSIGETVSLRGCPFEKIGL